MDEKQLIRQLKQLQEIKPSKDWVVLTKKKIFGDVGDAGTVWDWLFLSIKRPALVVAPLVLMAAVLGGVFVYFNFLPKIQVPSIIQIFENQETKKMISSLEGLEASLNKVALSLDNLKNLENTSEALTLTGVVEATAQEGERVADRIKGSQRDLPNKVLASLKGIEGASKELKKTNSILQKEMFETYLRDLKGRTLNQEDQARLEKAEEYYKAGREEEAMILITRIGN